MHSWNKSIERHRGLTFCRVSAGHTRGKRWGENAPPQAGLSQAQTERQWSTCTLLSLSSTQLRGGVCVCASCERRESQCHTHKHAPLYVKLLGVELKTHTNTHMHPAKPDCSSGSDKARFWEQVRDDSQRGSCVLVVDKTAQLWQTKGIMWG